MGVIYNGSLDEAAQEASRKMREPPEADGMRPPEF
jgi:hypothetical protein